jgi:hypothetical protein
MVPVSWDKKTARSDLITISSLLVERSFKLLPPEFKSAETYNLSSILGDLVSNPEKVSTWNSLVIPSEIYEEAAQQLSELHGRAMVATETSYSALNIPGLDDFTKTLNN